MTSRIAGVTERDRPQTSDRGPQRLDGTTGMGTAMPQPSDEICRVRPDGAPALTARDLEALRHLAVGRSTAQIAAAMSISTNTVRTRIRSILRKLAVGRRGEAVRRGRELGLLPQGRRPATVTDTEPLNCRTGTAG
ncbi:response regulator transcription factor [Geodermatophilus sabuli]|nr:helix-turn-helix transcriptional regulator [Geodermatophilus sabuli]MBB3086024.1 DNA-binding CsgD family transcriptional regulator [Geodermatophilus sabuli]